MKRWGTKGLAIAATVTVSAVSLLVAPRAEATVYDGDSAHVDAEAVWGAPALGGMGHASLGPYDYPTQPADGTAIADRATGDVAVSLRRTSDGVGWSCLGSACAGLGSRGAATVFKDVPVTPGISYVVTTTYTQVTATARAIDGAAAMPGSAAANLWGEYRWIADSGDSRLLAGQRFAAIDVAGCSGCTFTRTVNTGPAPAGAAALRGYGEVTCEATAGSFGGGASCDVSAVVDSITITAVA